MKREIAWYVGRCLIGRKVKTEHQKPHGKLQPLDILRWKWEKITMDFIIKWPRSTKRFDAIWLIMDRLTKIILLLSIKESSLDENWPTSMFVRL